MPRPSGGYVANYTAPARRTSYGMWSARDQQIARQQQVWPGEVPAREPDLQLWLDASDSSSVTLNGSTVSQWNDKSGNGNHATQTTAANQPTYTSAGLNGFNVITFDGTNDFMDAPAAWIASISSAFSIYYVFVPKGNGTGPDVYRPEISTFRGVYDDGAFHYRKNTSTSGAAYPFASASTGWSNYDGVGTYAVDTAAMIRFTSGGSGSTWGVWKNGTQESTSKNVGGNPQGDITAIRLGAQRLAERISNIVIAEVVCLKTPGTGVSDKVEGYLAWKWGLQGSLPNTHAYYSNPPA